MPTPKPYYALPMEETITNLDYYERNLELNINFKTASQKLLDELKHIHYPEVADEPGKEAVPESASIDPDVKQRMAELELQISDAEGRIKLGYYHVETYQKRVENDQERFDKESKEANAGWDKVWDDVTEVATQSGDVSLTRLLQSYPVADQEDKEKFSQELKNEYFKKFVKKIKDYKNHKAGKRPQLRKA